MLRASQPTPRLLGVGTGEWQGILNEDLRFAPLNILVSEEPKEPTTGLNDHLCSGTRHELKCLL